MRGFLASSNLYRIEREDLKFFHVGQLLTEICSILRQFSTFRIQVCTRSLSCIHLYLFFLVPIVSAMSVVFTMFSTSALPVLSCYVYCSYVAATLLRPLRLLWILILSSCCVYYAWFFSVSAVSSASADVFY